MKIEIYVVTPNQTSNYYNTRATLTFCSMCFIASESEETLLYIFSYKLFYSWIFYYNLFLGTDTFDEEEDECATLFFGCGSTCLLKIR